MVLSRVAYGKLAAMYRRNAPPGDPELPPSRTIPRTGNGWTRTIPTGTIPTGTGTATASAPREGPSRRRSRAPPPNRPNPRVERRSTPDSSRFSSGTSPSRGTDSKPPWAPARSRRSATRSAPGRSVSRLRSTRFSRVSSRRFPTWTRPSALAAISSPARRDSSAGVTRPTHRSWATSCPRWRVRCTPRSTSPNATINRSRSSSVPGWTDEPSWVSLSESPRVRSKFVVAAADHGYCDGAAHQRKASFRGSSYDTGVFVLQSSRAAASAAGRRVVAGPTEPGGLPRFEAEVRAGRRSRGRGSRRASSPPPWGTPPRRGDGRRGRRKRVARGRRGRRRGEEEEEGEEEGE